MPNPPTPADIVAARRRLGLTQAALAARVGCSLAAVAHWEHGIRVPTGLYLRELLRVMADASDAPAPEG